MSATEQASAVTGPPLSRAVGAVYIAFIVSGFAFASWASRIPQIRDSLAVSPAQLGFILLCVAAGSIMSIPLAGTIVGRFGEARTVAIMSAILACGVLLVGIGTTVGVPPVCAGLVLVGFGNGAWDVAMNVQGAAVERDLSRSIMSRFHAGFSVGTVVGAGVGAAMVALGIGVMPHLIVVAGLVVAIVPVTALRGFLPHVV
jgi:predicted MFS family arabinose efflux permease